MTPSKNMSVPDPASGNDDEIVETDFIVGGWEAWDLTGRSLRSFSERGLSPAAPRADDPSALLAKAVAEVVFTWRTDRGMRQREAAEHLGVGQSWISRIERCDAPVSIDLLARVASATGSDVSLRIVPHPVARPTRRIVRTGRSGRATVQLVITGPEARAPWNGEGLGGPAGEPPADPRSPGPIF